MTGSAQVCAGGYHDVGGAADKYNSQAIDLREPPIHQWEKEAEVVAFVLLLKKKLFVTDELRRTCEGLPASGQALPYYARWTMSAANLLREKGFITEDDLASALGPHADNSEPKFRVGESVKVLDSPKMSQWRKPHLRMPGFLFGAKGKITGVNGLFHNTEAMALGAKEAIQPEYRVAFPLANIWGAPSATEDGKDVVEVDVLEYWLESKGQSEGARDVYPEAPATKHQAGHHEHEAKHHHHDGHTHAHETRGQVEQTAVDREGAPAPGQHICELIVQLVVKKGIVTAAEIRETIAASEKEAELLKGQRIIAKAWYDPEFKDKLLKDTSKAVKEGGFGTGKWNESDPTMRPGDDHSSGDLIYTVENTDDVHNVTVCTLCSCYPMAILGRPPLWYKSSIYRARVVREPRQVLKEFGTVIPPNTQVKVHDATADCRYLVLPKRPKGTEGWTEEELVNLVTRDSMVGVEILKDYPSKP